MANPDLQARNSARKKELLLRENSAKLSLPSFFWRCRGKKKKKGVCLTAGSSSRADLCPKFKERLLSFFLSHSVTPTPPSSFHTDDHDLY